VGVVQTAEVAVVTRTERARGLYQGRWPISARALGVLKAVATAEAGVHKHESYCRKQKAENASDLSPDRIGYLRPSSSAGFIYAFAFARPALSLRTQIIYYIYDSASPSLLSSFSDLLLSRYIRTIYR
jgi:hypothetical protein